MNEIVEYPGGVGGVGGWQRVEHLCVEVQRRRGGGGIRGATNAMVPVVEFLEGLKGQRMESDRTNTGNWGR